ncbi:uncharacterized protein J3R85_008371 [Psidium guajava]|nr:uncharacterized protein J3R85_008371 [Psidium guajava]
MPYALRCSLFQVLEQHLSCAAVEHPLSLHHDGMLLFVMG